ncbi:hypothetical protein L1887_24988 [Cichorium endivia]|nr:hypothetical protein L1887_24988 [Cichorium endivia]
MYSGNCFNIKCDIKCRTWERATHGACHQREGHNGCYCYYDDCGTSPSPSKDLSPTPPKAGTPPTAGGGSASPPAGGGSASPPAGGGSTPPPAGGGSGGGSTPPPASGGSGGGSAPPPKDDYPCQDI